MSRRERKREREKNCKCDVQLFQPRYLKVIFLRNFSIINIEEKSVLYAFISINGIMDISFGNIENLFKICYSEVSKTEKLAHANSLIRTICEVDWSFLKNLPNDTGSVTLTSQENLIKYYFKCSVSKIVLLITDSSLRSVSVRLTYALLMIFYHLKEPNNINTFSFIVSTFLKVVEGKCSTNLGSSGIVTYDSSESNSDSSGVCIPALLYSFLLIVEENFNLLKYFSTNEVANVLNLAAFALVLPATTIKEKAVYLIMKIMSLHSNIGGGKILMEAMMTFQKCLKQTRPNKYCEISMFFFENLKMLNEADDSEDDGINKALFSLALDILIDFAPTELEKDWVNTVNAMITYIPPTIIHGCIVKIIGNYSVFMNLYDIIEVYIVNALDRNISSILEDLEKSKSICFGIFSLNKNRCVAIVWQSVLDLVQFILKCGITGDTITFVHRVVVTQARIEELLQLKFYEFNLINDMRIPTSLIGNFLGKFWKSTKMYEHYPALLTLCVDFLHIYGKEATPFVMDIFTLPWLEENAVVGSIDITTGSKCFDGLFNYAVAKQEIASESVPKILKFMQKVVEFDPTLTSRYTYLLPRFVILRASQGNFDLVDCLVDHIALKMNKEVYDEEIEQKLMCLISGRCYLQKLSTTWDLRCVDCDSALLPNPEPMPLYISQFTCLLSKIYISSLSEDVHGKYTINVAENLKRYMNHSEYLRDDKFLSKLTDLIISHNSIRDKLVSCMQIALYNFDGTVNVKFGMTILCKIVDTLFDKDWKENETVQVWITHIIKVILELTKIPTRSFLIPSIKVLIIFGIDYGIEEQMLNEILKNMGSYYNIAVHEFLIEYELEFSKFFVDILVNNISTYEMRIKESLPFIAKIFGYSTAKFLESRCTAYMTCYALTTFNSKQIKYFLNNLAELINLRVSHFITLHFSDILIHLYFNEEGDRLVKACRRLQRLTRHDIKTLVYHYYKRIMRKVLINVQSPMKVIRFISSMSKEGDCTLAIKCLYENVTGALSFISGKLITPGTPRHIIEKCLKAPSYLMKILGPQLIDDVRVKLFTTLKTALPPHYKTYPHLCLQAWMYFIYSNDLTLLGANLPTIFLELLKLFYKFPQDVSNTFYYLIVEHESVFSEHIPALHFVPDHCNVKMHEVWLVIQRSLKRNDGVVDKLRRVMRYVDNDVVESKVYALQGLNAELKNNISTLYDMALKNEVLDPVFKDIVDCLMDNVQNRNPEVKAACGSCLGELGAIDPSRFEDYMKKRSPNSYIIQTEEFAFWCISELLKTLHESKSSDFMNTIASCTQELLKLYMKKDKTPAAFFKKFSDNERFILEPLLSTRYIFKEMEEITISITKLMSPVISQSPLKWTFTWARHLISMLPDNFAKSVFKVCRSAMKIDLSFSEAIFPFIILETFRCCSEKCSMVLEQGFKSVLRCELDVLRNKTPSRNWVRKKSDLSGKEQASQVLGIEKSIQIVHDVLDFLYAASIDIEMHQNTVNDEKVKASNIELTNVIKLFLSSFPLSALSWKSYTQKNYYRSLFYLERHFADEKNPELNLLPLRNIYTKLNDMDALYGITKSSTGVLSSEATMLNDIVSGNFQNVTGMYALTAKEYSSGSYFRGLMQCYLNVNDPYTALHVSKSFMQEKTYFDPSFYIEYIEILWAAGEMEDTSEMLASFRTEMREGWAWPIDIVTTLDLIRKENYGLAKDKLKSISLRLVEELSLIKNTTIGNYLQGYDIIVRLHIANEIEKFVNIIQLSCDYFLPETSKELVEFQQVFKKRVDLVRSCGGHVQEVLFARETMYTLASHMTGIREIKDIEKYFQSRLGEVLIELARFARKNGNLQAAYTNLSLAEKYSVSEIFIEKAKYHRSKHETESAVMVLTQGLNELQNDNMSDSDRKLCAKVKLLIAKFNEKKMNVHFKEGSESYLEAANIYNLEKNYVYLANYLQKVHQEDYMPDSTAAKRMTQLKSAENFSRSLLFGSKYVYHSMSSLLNLWLDYGARLFRDDTNHPLNKRDGQQSIHYKQRKESLEAFSNLMMDNVRSLPSYLFMTSFSLILSRINHKCTPCYDILKLITEKIIRCFPQQAMWMVISYYNWSDEVHKVRIRDIVEKLKSCNDDGLDIFIRSFIKLASSLITVCKKRVPNKKAVALSSISDSLKKMKVLNGVNVMIPSQKFRTISLPNYKYCDTGLSTDHNPFPLPLVYFADVKEVVEVLFSVQKPKKIEFIGTDGNVYPILCKSVDDLRLDSRIMEFNSLVNMCLRRNPASHDRNLHIRTYSVVPLNHECGLIEWLPNLKTFRGIISAFSKKLNISIMEVSKLKTYMIPPDSKLSEKMDLFNELYSKHPPVLHKWFFENFPKADSWYIARNTFVQTIAVMSISGYAVGLGDRHGENILIDTITGEVVHVDFNCVFNKGDRLRYPETVPFRLTHNIVKVMGPTGVDGVFTRCCEIVSRVLRANSDHLVSILKPFLYYDIRNSTTHVPSLKQWAHIIEQDVNEEALNNIMAVEKKLLGCVRTKDLSYTKPLSAEGQVRYLVMESMDIENLCKMYVGWAAFL